MGQTRGHGASVKLVLVMALAACGSKSQDHGKVDKLHVTVNGKEVPITGAYMSNPSRDLYTFVLGDKSLSCTSHAGAVFGFTVAKRVSPQGEERWAVVDVSGRDTPITILNPGVVTLAGPHVGNMSFVDGTKFSATGEFDAVECPVVEPSGIGAPKTPHPSNAKISIAGRSLLVRGATVQARPGVEATDKPNLVLSTNVKDCSKVSLPAPVVLERVDGKWSLHGTWIDKRVDNIDAPDLTFSANMVGKSADGPTLDLQLSGKAQIGAYAVELMGVVQAIECVR